MVQFIAALILAALAGWAIHFLSSGVIDRAVSAFRELLGGWRADPWPRGVQEEDRDRPWGARREVPASQEPPVVATTRLTARTRAR